MVENNLRQYVNDFFKDLELYDDYKNDHKYKSVLMVAIDVFLDHASNYTAFEVYQAFFMIYQITPEDKSEGEEDPSLLGQPNALLDLVNTMRDYEQKTGDLIERQRDHFIHSVNVFLLGLAIYSQNKSYREEFQEYIEKSDYKKFYKTEDGEFSDEEFLYRWGVAALFHDIGYPFEIIGKQLNKFINDSVESISNAYDVNVGIDFDDFDDFNSIVNLDYTFADDYRELYSKSKIIDLFKPTEIMAHKIAHNFSFNNQEYKKLLKDLNAYVIRMKEKNFIDHGFFSAILVLNSYGYLIQEFSKRKEFFFYPIVDSATAILLHNYYNKRLQTKDFFNLGPLYVESHPIAYLLILCDELQEWDRKPFGLIDKQKFYVDDLNIEINNERMDVEYLLNYGSMGLGFEKEKKKTIYDSIDVERSIFPVGLSVIVKSDPKIDEDLMRGINIEDIDAPDALLRNVEKLAVEIHQQYIDTTTRMYEEKKAEGKLDDQIIQRYNDLKEFNKLSSHLKLANIRQAKSIPKKLNLIGCEIAPVDDKRPAIETFLDKEVEDLAIYEHQQWCNEKEGCGWTYSEEKNADEFKTPFLVSWEELPEDSKQFDRDTVRNIPHLLDSIGLKVVRSKIRLLTFEMHKDYLKRSGKKKIKVGEEEKDINKCTSEELFNELPEYIQFSNYKQAIFIKKILNERKYELVDSVDKRDAVDEFDKQDLDYFAQREHENWYLLKVNLGWTYGTDGEEKTSPNLLLWDDENLDKSVKEANKLTFENLPKLCSEPSIQLKIVKSE